MIGTLLNAAAVLVGGAAGAGLGSRLPEKLKETVIAVLGLFTLAYGIVSFAKSQNVLVVLGSILLGALLGEWWKIEDGLHRFATWLEGRLMPGGQASEKSFVRGFLTTAVIYCAGPMAILGSIQDGLNGDYSLLAVKAVLDGFASLAFASSLGIGVMFSAVPVLLYQGGLTLAAAQVQAVVSEAMMTEMTATGGLILMAMAVGSLLEIKPIRSGNLLPALLIAPLLVLVFQYFGLY